MDRKRAALTVRYVFCEWIKERPKSVPLKVNSVLSLIQSSSQRGSCNCSSMRSVPRGTINTRNSCFLSYDTACCKELAAYIFRVTRTLEHYLLSKYYFAHTRPHTVISRRRKYEFTAAVISNLIYSNVTVKSLSLSSYYLVELYNQWIWLILVKEH